MSLRAVPAGTGMTPSAAPRRAPSAGASREPRRKRGAVLRVAFARGRCDFGLLLGGFARWAVLLFGLLWVAAIVFPSVKPADVLATLGVGSVAVGFAFKDILQNWLSGLLILYRRPFRQGDQIRSGEFEGTVEHIEARATLLRTYDGQRVVIPNADIYTRSVTVRTAFPLSRSEYDVGVGYGDDPERACRVILDALRGTEGVARDPAPEAYPWSFDPSSVAIKVFWWSDARRAEQARDHTQTSSWRDTVPWGCDDDGFHET